MPFVELKLADVAVEQREYSSIPVGTYVFKLQPGAKTRVNQKSGKEELSLMLSVVEGDFSGRAVFVNYPDPQSLNSKGEPMSWVGQALKRLESSLGVDATDGEDTITYLNRVATSSPAHIEGKMVPETRKNVETGKYEVFIRDGETEPRAKFDIWSPKPAA